MLRKGALSATVLVLAILLSTASSLADCPTLVLEGGPYGMQSGFGRAPMARYRSIHTVYLITPAEMASSGFPAGVSPTAIGWRNALAPGITATGSLKIYLQNTANSGYSKGTSFSSAIIGMTLVHDGPANLPDAATYFDVKFAGGSPFTYTGGGLYVAFDWLYPVGTLSPNVNVFAVAILPNGANAVGTAQTTGTPPASDTMTMSAFRPETYFSMAVPNDVSVDNIKTYGLVPNPFAGPQVISATVTNHGDAAVVNLPVTLTVTGANPFTDTRVQSLDPCSKETISFAALPPANLGSETVTVTIPADDAPANNTRTIVQNITTNQYSYMDGRPSDAGVGAGFFNSEFTARFDTLASTQIDSVTADFPLPLAGASYRVSIRQDNGLGRPGTSIYTDAFNRTVVQGNQSIRLPSPLIIPAGPFYVGLIEGITDLPLGFNYEFPLRSGAFFVLDAGEFVDLATVGGANYKLNLGAVLGDCKAHMSVDVTPDSGSVCGAGSITFTANTANSTGGLSYQWTQNGVDITGALQRTRTVTKSSAGSFTYNCKVTDDAGCTDIKDLSDAIGVWATTSPAEANGLAFSPNTQTLTWSPVASAARYDVVRGSVSSLPVGPGGGDETCIPNIVGTSTSDATIPPAGSAFWYLVRGKNACGSGNYGSQSNGTPRTTNTCL